MIPIYFGTTNLSKLYAGGTEVVKAYIGTTEVYSGANEAIMPLISTSPDYSTNASILRANFPFADQNFVYFFTRRIVKANHSDWSVTLGQANQTVGVIAAEFDEVNKIMYTSFDNGGTNKRLQSYNVGAATPFFIANSAVWSFPPQGFQFRFHNGFLYSLVSGSIMKTFPNLVNSFNATAAGQQLTASKQFIYTSETISGDPPYVLHRRFHESNLAFAASFQQLQVNAFSRPVFYNNFIYISYVNAPFYTNASNTVIRKYHESNLVQVASFQVANSTVSLVFDEDFVYLVGSGITNLPNTIRKYHLNNFVYINNVHNNRKSPTINNGFIFVDDGSFIYKYATKG